MFKKEFLEEKIMLINIIFVLVFLENKEIC